MKGVVVLEVEVEAQEGFAPIMETLAAACHGRTDIHRAYLGINKVHAEVIAAFSRASDVTTLVGDDV